MRRSTDDKGRRMTPPSPSYMSNDQFAKYLADLRTNRAARPGGARPQPSRRSQERPSLDTASQVTTGPERIRTPSQPPGASADSTSARPSVATGRDYYPAKPTVPLKPYEVVPTATYMERGQRWMEKEEAVSLREAMEDMDIRRPRSGAAADDESRLYNAALDEAAELVWQHQHGGPAPKPDGPYRYRSHLRKNSYAHASTASVGSQGDDVAPSGLKRDIGSRSTSLSSTDSAGSSQGPRHPLREPNQAAAADAMHGARPHGHAATSRRRTSLKRDISGEVQRPFSGDQIWEEPEASTTLPTAAFSGRASPEKLDGKSRSPLNRARLRFALPGPGDPKALDRVEIHRNPPTQTRNPQYTTNGPLPRPVPDPSLERRNGVEVRGQDIRAATSRKLRDRSVRLPEPTAVSDSPGRPIVSFDANWTAPDESTDGKPDEPAAQVSPGNSRDEPNARRRVDMPRIAVAEDKAAQPRATANAAGVPSIAVAGPDGSPAVPAISVPTIITTEEAGGGGGGGVTAPQQGRPAARRPLPMPGASPSAPMPRGHWSPAPGTVRRATASCHECGLAIEGRFVALAGSPERFHPHCFRCFSCGTSLEAMEISPEPAGVRAARLERIRLRAAGGGAAAAAEEAAGQTAADDDGDERLRFFCHLDWHELFAPRCRHCKTPILGEHVVALGHHWHHGHFFCAECGDAFERGATHIEKDGYAWCVGCQAKRTERRAPRCGRCRGPVVGRCVRALGAEWHERCFRCAVCGGGFDDGQIFPRGGGGDGKDAVEVLCTDCRARELKS